MAQPTLQVKDANGATQTINTVNPNGTATGANSQSVVIATDQSALPIGAPPSLPLPAGAATEGTAAAILAKIIAAPATEATLASIDAALPVSIGQKAASGSTSVVLASDQPALPVTAAALPLPAGAATEASLGTDGSTPPSMPGGATGIKGWLRWLGSLVPTLANMVGVSSALAMPVRVQGQDIWRCSFADTGASLVTADFMQMGAIGAGMGVSQASSNLLVTTGTTVNSEWMARSVRSWQGCFNVRWSSILSQRIVNQNFEISVADLVGENLAYVINSATSVTVTFPSVNPWTTANVGQFVNLSVITGAAGIPGRWAIAGVSGLTVTFTVAAWPASGSGTLALWGWSYFRTNYSNITATNALFGTQRKGWQNADVTATIQTTASPGHVGQMFCDSEQAILSDALRASTTAYQWTARANFVENLPDEATTLYLFIRVLNGTTAPASTTTWTIGFVSVANWSRTTVSVAAATQNGALAAICAHVLNTVTVTAANLQCNVNQIVGGTPITISPQGATNKTLGVSVSGAVNNTDYSAQAWAAASGSGATIAPADGQGASCGFDVSLTAWTAGASTGLVVKLDESYDNGTTWNTIWMTEPLTAIGHVKIPSIPIGGRRRMSWVNLSGAATTATVTVTAMSSGVAMLKQAQYFDRTANVTSGTAALGNGAAYDIAGLKALTFVMDMGTATAPASYKVQMSQNGSGWYDASAAISCPASTLTPIPLTAGVIGRFARLVCTVAGTTAVANSAQIYGTN